MASCTFNTLFTPENDGLHTQTFPSGSIFRRQLSLPSSLACRFCGNKSLTEEAFDSSSLNTNLLLDGCLEDSHVKKHQNWWLAGWHLLGSRRRCSGDEAHCRTIPRWKQLLRKLRAETRKMKFSKPCSGFNYDPLSYAMNFDEGCWQCDFHGQGFIHSMRFSAPSIIQSESFRSQDCEKTTEWNDSLLFTRSDSSNSVWQRRKVCQPPSLDMKLV